ncbi:hypothetical protein PYH37_006343 (plasmid) [Sinorhizobium numidicum]|uniref:DUF4158 domain-containing protein n=1 Tax=Sinorhizobium numidicum TaxID=680248 RepID=A0ABY8D411_9HYPH|nr:hypothetical protein [Sinorhizobium numidicum]WEX79434.1 hypothetical protein PYH37_006343 [Sinorhizobium numidicum]WEX85610.1 hypothetical protein PYH38_006041 [Sinorhizobium numidicum]
MTSGKWQETLAEETWEAQAQATVRDLDIGEIMALSLHCSELDLLAYTRPRLRAHDLELDPAQHRIMAKFGWLWTLRFRFPSPNNSGH